jgi:hypothetical protein
MDSEINKMRQQKITTVMLVGCSFTWSRESLAIKHKSQQPSQGNEAAQDAPS